MFNNRTPKHSSKNSTRDHAYAAMPGATWSPKTSNLTQYAIPKTKGRKYGKTW